MKKLLFVLVLAAGFIWCWQNPALVRTYAAKASHEAGMFLLNLFEEEKLPDPALPIVSEQPDNIYFTRERIDYGTYPEHQVLVAATPVRKVGEGNGKFVVESENKRLVVDPQKLTRDPKEIAQLIRLAQSSKPPDPAAAQAIQTEISVIELRLSDTRMELKTKLAQEAVYRQRGIDPPPALKTDTEYLKSIIYGLEKRKLELSKRVP